MTSYNTFEKFIETMQEEIFRLAVYKKLFTPYEIDNKFIDALFAMAAAQKKLGKYHKALEYLEKLLEIEPQAVNAKALKQLILQKYIVKND